MTETEHMLRRLARPARVSANRRVKDENADIWISKIPSIKEVARKVHNADAIFW